MPIQGALGITAFEPDLEVVEKVKQAIAASGANIVGVEYLMNTSDDQLYFYDINPLSNFVTNATRVVDFDPVPRFVDFIIQQATA